MDRSNEGLPPEAGGRLPDRREVLKRGAVLGGTVVWASPVVQAFNISAADAASGETTVPPPPPPPPTSPPPPPPAPPALPSHGFFLLQCDGVYFGYQIVGEESSLTPGSVQPPDLIGSPGNGNDIPYWEGIGFTGIVTKKSADKRWNQIRDELAAGVTSRDGGTVLQLTAWPAECTLINAFIWDGSFQTDPDGDKVRPAVSVGGSYYFFK